MITSLRSHCVSPAAQVLALSLRIHGTLLRWVPGSQSGDFQVNQTNRRPVLLGKPWDRQPNSGKLRRKLVSVPGLRRISGSFPQNG